MQRAHCHSLVVPLPYVASRHTLLDPPPSLLYTQWLDACLALQQAKSATSPGAAATVLSLPLAAITGASSLFDRERCAQEAAKREAVAGKKGDGQLQGRAMGRAMGRTNLFTPQQSQLGENVPCHAPSSHALRFCAVWFRNRGGPWVTAGCPRLGRGDQAA